MNDQAPETGRDDRSGSGLPSPDDAGFDNDYDLLTQFEAGRRLVEDIELVRQQDSDATRARLNALEDAVRRHRDVRPAERSTFFSSTGRIERVDTSEDS